MASVKYIQKGKTNTIYLRFINGREIDLSTSTKITVKPQYWNKKHQKIKDTLEVKNRHEINKKLALLKLQILDSFNLSYISGEYVDKRWLDEQVREFFGQPKVKKHPGPHLIYLSDFAQWWLDNKADKWKISASKYMTERVKGQYQRALDNLKQHEGKNKARLKDTDSDFLDGFARYLTKTREYAVKTAKRKITRIKFFCTRADEMDLPVNRGYQSRIFVEADEEDYKHPYLNEAEIKELFEYRARNKTMDVARDNWIIGLWTGLRVSDFLTRLKIDNVREDFIEIKTQKTGTPVAIPLHPQVKATLDKYDGNLPPKITEQDFNERIKTLAQLIGFDEMMKGGIAKKTKKGIRKVIGMYPKWKLVTSHICRRSFCTNLIGKVPNQVIMDVAGWSNESQMFSYVKKTNRESAIKLKEYWENGQ